MKHGKFMILLAAAVITLSVATSGCKQKSSNKLPTMRVTAGAEIPWSKKLPCTIFFEDDTISATIHCRGGSSSAYPKHSYAIKLGTKKTLCGLPADNEWILNANYIDKTFMRHKLSYDLFRAMGDYNIAAQSRYLLLDIDGQSKGLYVLMQRLDIQSLDIDEKDTAAVIFKEPPFLYEQRIVPQEEKNYYQQIYPKIKKSDKTTQIEQLRNLIFNASDSLFEKEIEQVFDMRNVVDWQILQMLTNNSDGQLKGFYLYRKDSKNPYRFAIWDYDHSFGRDGDGEYNMLDRIIDINRSPLIRRLMLIPSYRQRLATRWQQLRNDDVISVEALSQRIGTMTAEIGEAVKINAEIWPVDNKFYYDDMDFEAELNVMRQFINLNINRLDQYFSVN